MIKSQFSSFKGSERGTLVTRTANPQSPVHWWYIRTNYEIWPSFPLFELCAKGTALKIARDEEKYPDRLTKTKRLTSEGHHDIYLRRYKYNTNFHENRYCRASTVTHTYIIHGLRLGDAETLLMPVSMNLPSVLPQVSSRGASIWVVYGPSDAIL
jgi:hypothetical protein